MAEKNHWPSRRRRFDEPRFPRHGTKDFSGFGAQAL
jgi:hypothetical protein